MRRFVRPVLLLGIMAISLYAISNAQDAAPEKESADAAKFKIVPLVTLKPGETKELLLSTWCTVGVTRGGGFDLAEMRDGKPVGNGTKTYREGGVTISVPDFDEGEKFASSPEYALLKERDVDAFKVTVTASASAKPGLMEMHLVDATCAGHCKTDFRVLVVAK